MRCSSSSGAILLPTILLGEPIGQDFSGNDNRYIPEVHFDTNMAAQGEKWAFIDSSIGTSLTTFDIFVIEYLG